MSPFLEIRKSHAFYKSAIDKMWECNVRCFSIAKCNQVQSAQLKHFVFASLLQFAMNFLRNK